MSMLLCQWYIRVSESLLIRIHHRGPGRARWPGPMVGHRADTAEQDSDERARVTRLWAVGPESLSLSCFRGRGPAVGP
jgi:hypothetical protein